MTKDTALNFIEKVAQGTGLDFDPRPFEGMTGVSRGTKGLRKGPNVFVAVFYGGRDPGIRVTVRDKLQRFELGTPVEAVVKSVRGRL